MKKTITILALLLISLCSGCTKIVLSYSADPLKLIEKDLNNLNQDEIPSIVGLPLVKKDETTNTVQFANEKIKYFDRDASIYVNYVNNKFHSASYKISTDGLTSSQVAILYCQIKDEIDRSFKNDIETSHWNAPSQFDIIFSLEAEDHTGFILDWSYNDYEISLYLRDYYMCVNINPGYYFSIEN